jgi:SAM-dependent methyltransferase
MERRVGNAMDSSMTDWNLRYEQDDTPWDKGAAHPVLLDMFTHGALSGRVLVPGCGTGHDVRELSRRGLTVVGLDVAPLALDRARLHPPVGDETYVLGDLFDLPHEYRGTFDGAFEHTCFCAINPSMRERYVEAVASALKPGGRLLSVFFVNPDNDGQGPPFGCTKDELDGLFAGKFHLLEEHFEIRTFPERQGRELLRLLERV